MLLAKSDECGQHLPHGHHLLVGQQVLLALCARAQQCDARAAPKHRQSYIIIGTSFQKALRAYWPAAKINFPLKWNTPFF